VTPTVSMYAIIMTEVTNWLGLPEIVSCAFLSSLPMYITQTQN